jgi:predicted house-cleaning noncanonical NTP pyrophosphatase (MazG superfamily)
LDKVQFITGVKVSRNYTIMPPQIPVVQTSNIIAISNKCSTFKNLKQLPEELWNKLLQKLNDNNITFIDLDEVKDLQLAIKILSCCKHYIGIDSFFMHMTTCYRIPRTIFWNPKCSYTIIEYGYTEGQKNVLFENFDKYLESKEFTETVDSINWNVHSLT